MGKYCWKLQGESRPWGPSRLMAVPKLPSSKTSMGPSTTAAPGPQACGRMMRDPGGVGFQGAHRESTPFAPVSESIRNVRVIFQGQYRVCVHVREREVIYEPNHLRH